MYFPLTLSLMGYFFSLPYLKKKVQIFSFGKFEGLEKSL